MSTRSGSQRVKAFVDPRVVHALALVLLVSMSALASSASGADGRIASDRARDCASAPVHHEPGTRSDLRFLPWVTAGPRGRRIVGYLFYYGVALEDARVSESPGLVIYAGGRMPSGRGLTKILWVPQRPGTSMVILGNRLDGHGAFRQSPRLASGGVFPSIVRVPEAGCWRLTLRTGRVSARLAVLAIDPA